MKLLTLKEACERLNLSRTTVDRMRKSGQFIEVIKMGERKLFVREDELIAFIEGGAR